MKIHNKLIKSTTVAEKTDLWGYFIMAILTRTGLHSERWGRLEITSTIIPWIVQHEVDNKFGN